MICPYKAQAGLITSMLRDIGDIYTYITGTTSGGGGFTNRDRNSLGGGVISMAARKKLKKRQGREEEERRRKREERKGRKEGELEELLALEQEIHEDEENNGCFLEEAEAMETSNTSNNSSGSGIQKQDHNASCVQVDLKLHMY